eukprot:gene8231-9795_t
MRQGCYELIVLRSDDSLFEEIVIDGKNFLRAESGGEYKVKFIIHRDDFGNFPFQHAVCILSVDGTNTDSGAYLNLNLDSTFETRQVIFRGFRVDSDLLQAFVFSDLVAGIGPVNGTLKTGLLQVSVYEAERFPPPTHIYPPSFTAPPLRTVLEDKKFWQQPSLATVRGKHLKAPYSAADFRCMRKVPDATVSIQCHATGVLSFLQDQCKKFHSRSNHLGVAHAHIDLTDESNPVSPEPAPVPKPPVVVDLCDQAQNQEEIETEIEEETPVVVKKCRRSSRIAKKMRADETSIVQEDKEEFEVKVEKKSQVKSEYKKKKVVEVAARRKRSSKKTHPGEGAGAVSWV